MTELRRIVPLAENIDVDTPLVLCFGHAGSYGGTFRRWTQGVEKTVFLPVEFPREYESFDNITVAVAEYCAPLLKGRGYCLFGHSMGAAFAFETEYILEKKYGLKAECVFVCGRHSPDIVKNEFYHSSMGNERLILEMKRLGGTDERLLKQKEYADIILPFIRNDYRIHESYSYNGHRISCPIEAALGTDDISVSLADINGWRNMTDSGFTLKLFSGGHFFLYDDMTYFTCLQEKCKEIFGL